MSKRPSLSSVLPAKGEATRPEPMPEPAGGTSVPAPKATEPDAQPKRRPTTFKIREDVYLRLHVAAGYEGRDKQDIADEALDAWLTAKGYK